MAVEATRPGLPAYAELRCVSTFSFLVGASQPEELVERAKKMGYSALALTDECSMAGIVRAHVAAKRVGLKLLVGSQFRVEVQAGDEMQVLQPGRAGLQPERLRQPVRVHHRAAPHAPKGTYRLRLRDLATAELDDCVVVASPLRGATPEQLVGLARWLLDALHRPLLAGRGTAAATGRRDVAVPAARGQRAVGHPAGGGRATSTCTCARARRCTT